MFEAQVAYYLNNYLGKYVYGLDQQSLKISVFKGDVVLRNLKLKPEALADLDLPITVKSGLVGSLTLKAGPFMAPTNQRQFRETRGFRARLPSPLLFHDPAEAALLHPVVSASDVSCFQALQHLACRFLGQAWAAPPCSSS